jgi:hypothetical protein
LRPLAYSLLFFIVSAPGKKILKQDKLKNLLPGLSVNINFISLINAAQLNFSLAPLTDIVQGKPSIPLTQNLSLHNEEKIHSEQERMERHPRGSIQI